MFGQKRLHMGHEIIGREIDGRGVHRHRHGGIGHFGHRAVEHPIGDRADEAMGFRQRNEVSRRDRPTRGMHPPHQSLASHNAARARIDLCMIDKRKLVARHGQFEIGHQKAVVVLAAFIAAKRAKRCIQRFGEC